MESRRPRSSTWWFMAIVAAASLLLGAFEAGRRVERDRWKAEAGQFGPPAFWAWQRETTVDGWLVVEGRPDGTVRVEVEPTGVIIRGKRLDVPLPLVLNEEACDVHRFAYRPDEGIEHTTIGPHGTSRREVIPSHRMELDLIGRVKTVRGDRP